MEVKEDFVHIMKNTRCRVGQVKEGQHKTNQMLSFSEKQVSGKELIDGMVRGTRAE